MEYEHSNWDLECDFQGLFYQMQMEVWYIASLFDNYLAFME